ncbi:MAG: glycosyltransferase family 4 protein, partial [Mesorhizobium sp.]
MARRWTINGRFLCQPTTGVQRYAREVALALDALVAEGVPPARGLELDLCCPPGASDLPLSRIERREVGRAGGHIWEQVQLPLSVDGGLLSF